MSAPQKKPGRKGRLTNEEKRAIKEGLARGETPEELGKKYNVRPESIRKWSAAQPRRDQGPVAAAGIPLGTSRVSEALCAAGLDPVSVPQPPGELPNGIFGASPGNDTAKALASLESSGTGASDRSNGDAGTGAGGFSSSVPPTPAQLVAILEAVDLMTMRAIGTMRAPHIKGRDFEKAIELPKAEKEALTFLAPYAAEYAPMVTAYAKPVMAGLFVGVWAMSVTVRLKMLANLERDARGTEQAAPVDAEVKS